MVKGVLKIENSFTTLTGFDSDALAIVKDTLTYDDQEAIFQKQQLKFQIGMAFRYRAMGRVGWLKQRLAEVEQNMTICWFNEEENKFPTGHLDLVTAVLKEKDIGFSYKDLRKNLAKTVNFKLKTPFPEPRYYQEDMVRLALGHHRGVFESAVGTGKSLIMQMITHSLKVPTLIIVPSKDLGVQTLDSFTNHFGKDNVELLSSTTKRVPTKAVRICTIQTLNSLEKKGLLHSFIQDIGLICIDEVHHAGAKSYTLLLPYFDHIYYRFGFSGTFMRNDSRTLDMWGFLSTVLYRYGAAQATREGYLTPLKIVVHPIEGMRGANYHAEYTKNYCKNDYLLKELETILSTYVYERDQVLILVGRKEKSGGIIHQFLSDLGYHTSYVSGDSKRDDVCKALEEFNSKKIQILIGSSIIGEGIDVRSTDHLIMAQGGKSEIAVTQATGRAVRLFPGKEIAFLHDFRFLGTRYLEKHLNNRLGIYKKNFEGEVYE